MVTVKFVLGLAKSVVFFFGILALAIFTVGFVEGVRRELDKRTAGGVVEVKAELDSLINDFLAIEPRAKWPVLMADVNDETLVRSFVSGAQEAGVTLSPRQIEMARLMIVPRIKERLAVAVEKIDPNTRYLDAMAMVEKMESDTLVWFKKYEPAVAELLKKANDMPELDRVTL